MHTTQWLFFRSSSCFSSTQHRCHVHIEPHPLYSSFGGVGGARLSDCRSKVKMIINDHVHYSTLSKIIDHGDECTRSFLFHQCRSSPNVVRRPCTRLVLSLPRFSRQQDFHRASNHQNLVRVKKSN